MITKCPYCGIIFQIKWEELEGQLVIMCPVCKSVILVAQGMHIEGGEESDKD